MAPAAAATAADKENYAPARAPVAATASAASYSASATVLVRRTQPGTKRLPLGELEPSNVNPVDKFQIIIKSAHYKGEPWIELPWTSRYSLPLTVYPSLTVAELKSMLQTHPLPWIPKENLVLLHRGPNTPLLDGSSTLHQCGLKNKDTLLTCMEGRFTVRVYCFYPRMMIRIPVTSCFQTVGYLKEKIFLEKNIPVDDQAITRYSSAKKIDDETPLMALGVVRPYSNEMKQPSSADFKLRLPMILFRGPLAF